MKPGYRIVFVYPSHPNHPTKYAIVWVSHENEHEFNVASFLIYDTLQDAQRDLNTFFSLP